ncbi:MAG: RimK family alpha-L-glutamate ligase [Desulfatibacillaceae bacterium]
MILSMHPHYDGDERIDLTPAGRFTEAEIERIRKARAVVVPQSIKESQYSACRRNCNNVFPDYNTRFRFGGKLGNMRLFRKLDIPHPRSVGYVSAEEFHARHPGLATSPFDYPFVLKGNEGGGGVYVHLVRNREDLFSSLVHLGKMRNYPVPIVAQEFVPHGGRDLRVVVAGDQVRTYWRVQRKQDEFRNNLGRGGVIEWEMDPGRTEAGTRCVMDLCEKAGIDLAAVDVVFDATVPEPLPLVLEINFIFGRKGLGGSQKFRGMFKEVVDRWIRSLS